MSQHGQILNSGLKSFEKQLPAKHDRNNRQLSLNSKIRNISNSQDRKSRITAAGAIKTHTRKHSENNAIINTAKRVLFSSLDEDIARLEDVSSKNNCVRKNLQNAQEAVLFMDFFEKLSPIKNRSKKEYCFSHRNSSVNPFDLLINKYQAQKFV